MYLFFFPYSQGHKSFRLTKNHSVYTLVDLRSGKVNLKTKAKEEHCNEHPGQVLWFYCKRCDVPICMNCTVVEHPSGSHDLVKIGDAITGQRDEIQKLAETCKTVEKEVAKAFKQVHPIREKLESARTAANAAIDELKDKVQRLLLASLAKQTDELKKIIAGMVSVKEKAASAHEDELQMLSSRLKTALEMASQVTSEGSDCDVASVYKHLTTTLQQLGQIRVTSIDLGNVRFLEDSSLNTSVGCIGKIEETKVTHPTISSRAAPSNDLENIRVLEDSSMNTSAGCIGKIEETKVIHPRVGVKSFRMRNKKQWNAKWKMVKRFGDTGEGKLKDP